MKYHNLNKANTLLLKSLIREPYAWPGGYERLAITSDGAMLCTKCLKDNFRNILHSTKYQYQDGWQVNGAAYEAISTDCCDQECTSYCGHCNKMFGEII